MSGQPLQSTSRSIAVSITALVVANLVTVAGVILFGWSLMQILVVFWIESGIVGLLNIPKIALAGKPTTSISKVGADGPPLPKAAIIGFFMFHYGVFWTVHGVFLWTLPLTAVLWTENPTLGSTSAPFGSVNGGEVLYAVVILLASHIVSFVVNYVGRKEYLRVTANEQMFSVYGRVIVMHLVILVGGMIAGRIGSPVGVLVVLVTAKVVLDLALHYNEHRKANQVLQTTSPQSWATIDDWGSTPPF